MTETWNTLLRTPMGRLRATTIIEGISYLFLAGVAMPLKYAFDMPAAVRVGGWIHGVLFVAVMATLADVFFRRQLSFSRATMVVIATLWPVEDASTGLLMQNFYRLCEAQKLTKADALRQAQLMLISEQSPQDAAIVGAGQEAAIPATRKHAGRYAHPYFWAPFILMGNWL